MARAWLAHQASRSPYASDDRTHNTDQWPAARASRVKAASTLLPSYRAQPGLASQMPAALKTAPYIALGAAVALLTYVSAPSPRRDLLSQTKRTTIWQCCSERSMLKVVQHCSTRAHARETAGFPVLPRFELISSNRE